VVDATNFNGKKLLNGDFATAVNFQIGATTTAESKLGIQISKVDTSVLGTDLSDADASLSAISEIDDMISSLNTNRASLGAIQNRFEGVLTQLSAAQENTEAARSRIMDADYAAETAKLARAQVLQQAGVAMLSQANALPQNVLSLLR
jgi:flagellin